MSENDKLAWNEFANPMWEKMTSIMETGRDLPKGSIQNYGDNAMEMMTTNPETAEVAKNLGFKAVFTVVKNPFLINHFTNTGFSKDAKKSTEMVKRLE